MGKIGIYFKFNKMVYLSNYYCIILVISDNKYYITFVCRLFYIKYNLII